MHTSQWSSFFLGVVAVTVVTGRPEPPSPLQSSYSTMMNDLAPPSVNAPSASYGPSEMTGFMAPDPGTSAVVRRYARVSGTDSMYHQTGAYSSAKMDDDSSEPANYEYSYTVEDPPSVSEFGHEKRREGPAAMGRYHVLLPDGRRQIVEYEADQDGFRPRISYEEESGPY